MTDRALTTDEKKYAAEIFRDSVDFDKVRITRGNIAAALSATTIGNMIHLQPRDFIGATMDLSEMGYATLMHEMGHVWQYQRRGIGYITKSLRGQVGAWLRKGSRNAAYEWLPAAKAGIAWEKWNPEQQAECIACYNASWRRKQSGKAGTGRNPGNHSDDEIVALATKYMQKVWDSTASKRKSTP